MSSRFSAPLVLSFLLLFSAAAVSACSDARTFEVRGRVVGFGDDDRTIIVEHEDIPGFMPAMTMPFTVRDTAAASMLNVRDAIAFTLHVTGDSSWIADLRKLPDAALAEHPAGGSDEIPHQEPAPRILKVGDPAPDFELRTHADTTLTLAEFEGRAVVLTFIYTQCPLPQYCPLLSQNFANLQPMVEEQYGDQVQLLSVSFDPGSDTPQVLRHYAARYTDNLSSWTFATGDSLTVKNFAESFGEYYAPARSEIVHNLVTVLIGPDGRIRKYWRGNEWQPRDVMGALEGLNL